MTRGGAQGPQARAPPPSHQGLAGRKSSRGRVPCTHARPGRTGGMVGRGPSESKGQPSFLLPSPPVQMWSLRPSRVTPVPAHPTRVPLGEKQCGESVSSCGFTSSQTRSHARGQAALLGPASPAALGEDRAARAPRADGPLPPQPCAVPARGFLPQPSAQTTDAGQGDPAQGSPSHHRSPGRRASWVDPQHLPKWPDGKVAALGVPAAQVPTCGPMAPAPGRGSLRPPTWLRRAPPGGLQALPSPVSLGSQSLGQGPSTSAPQWGPEPSLMSLWVAVTSLLLGPTSCDALHGRPPCPAPRLFHTSVPICSAWPAPLGPGSEVKASPLPGPPCLRAAGMAVTRTSPGLALLPPGQRTALAATLFSESLTTALSGLGQVSWRRPGTPAPAPPHPLCQRVAPARPRPEHREGRPPARAQPGRTAPTAAGSPRLTSRPCPAPPAAGRPCRGAVAPGPGWGCLAQGLQRSRGRALARSVTRDWWLVPAEPLPPLSPSPCLVVPGSSPHPEGSAPGPAPSVPRWLSSRGLRAWLPPSPDGSRSLASSGCPSAPSSALPREPWAPKCTEQPDPLPDAARAISAPRDPVPCLPPSPPPRWLRSLGLGSLGTRRGGGGGRRGAPLTPQTPAACPDGLKPCASLSLLIHTDGCARPVRDSC